ncbi:MAG: hypothetical protein JXA00_00765 [Candidatus Thermoplasmatota archaeon]|nr:hypothetical protein [Candidatus Thermoplasmatota archaeon]
MQLRRLLILTTHILLTIVLILFILSGYGITNYQTIEPLTAGLLSKPTSYQLHVNLIIPLLILLALHIALPLWNRTQRQKHSP